MQSVGELIKPSLNEQTKPQGTRSYAHSLEVFVYIWRGLQAARFIAKDEVVDGTDYKYWREMLKDVDNEGLLRGLRGTEGFTGYMTWSAFRELCAPEKNDRSHKQFLPPPLTKTMTVDQRRAACRRMKLETGVGTL